jgi:hypothetical protein
MKIASLRALSVLALWLVSGCQSDKQMMSPEMSQVLSKRRLNKWEMDTSGLAQQKIDVQFNKLGDDIYNLPERPNSADTFLYKVVVCKPDRKYWILRSGGFSGHSILFGPTEIGK